MIDFYVVTLQGDVHLFSTQDGRIVEALAAPQEAGAPGQHLSHDHLQETFTAT